MKRLARPLHSMLGAASSFTVIFGLGFLLDCRMDPKADRSECWLTGGTLAGIGTAGQAGYRAGFWTPNPGIRQDERNRVAPTDTPQP